MYGRELGGGGGKRVDGGGGDGEGRNEVKRKTEKKREMNENKGDDRWLDAFRAALASNCRINSPRNLKIVTTIYASC